MDTPGRRPRRSPVTSAQLVGADDLTPRLAGRRLELLAQDKGLPLHLLAGVKVHKRWEDSSEVTEAELAAAVDELGSIKIG